MEVEDKDKLFQKLFFKKIGRALPKKKSDDVDIGMDLKDLTKEQYKMDAIPTLAPVDIVKKESIEILKKLRRNPKTKTTIFRRGTFWIPEAQADIQHSVRQRKKFAWTTLSFVAWDESTRQTVETCFRSYANGH